MLLINFEPVQLLQLLTSTVLPLLVGLVTTRDTNPGRRAILLALLSVSAALLAAMLAAIRAGAPFELVEALLEALATFLIAVGMHYGLWKHTPAPAALQNVTIPGLAALLTAWRDDDGITGRHSATGPAPEPAAIPGTVLPLSMPVTSRHVEADPKCIRFDPDREPDPRDPDRGRSCRLCPMIVPAVRDVVRRRV